MLLAGLGLVVGIVGGPDLARAQEESQDNVRVSPPTTTPTYKHREGEYGGATPGVVFPYSDESQKKRKRRPQPKKKNALYWVGFQPRGNGASRVFLQMTREPEYDQTVAGNVLLVTVVGVRNLSKNTLRRIETRYFDTSLLEVTGKRVKARRARKGQPAQKAGIQLRIVFKNPLDAAVASASTAKEADGFDYLYLDFGPATAVAKSDDTGDTGGD